MRRTTLPLMLDAVGTTALTGPAVATPSDVLSAYPYRHVSAVPGEQAQVTNGGPSWSTVVRVVGRRRVDGVALVSHPLVDHLPGDAGGAGHVHDGCPPVGSGGGGGAQRGPSVDCVGVGGVGALSGLVEGSQRVPSGQRVQHGGAGDRDVAAGDRASSHLPSEHG